MYGTQGTNNDIGLHGGVNTGMESEAWPSLF